MAISWAGGQDPTIPDYYLYSFTKLISIPIRKKFFWKKRRYSKERKEFKEIITSNTFYSFSKEERAKCIGATNEHVSKHGSDELKKGLSSSESRALSSMLNLP